MEPGAPPNRTDAPSLHLIPPLGLTLPKRCRKSNAKVCSSPAVCYAAWRSRAQSSLTLRDEAASGPSERLLQAIWRHQRIRSDNLKTTDGCPVRVLHPGFLNRAAGPDFRGAIIQFGDALAQSGDVEIDLRRSGWTQHHHANNPNYRNVLLHVVWEPGTGGDRPTLALAPVLDAPLSHLQHILDLGTSTLLENGRCSAPLAALSEDRISVILDQAALVRLGSKASQFESRARQVGWEQSLWEGLFGALGYKSNYWPMRRLGEMVSLLRDGATSSSVLELQARLLGVAGMMPNQFSGLRPSAQSYLRGIWDRWWRDREIYSGQMLPRSLWSFHGLRPANHPQRRLALAAHWLALPSFIPRIESWFLETKTVEELTAQALATFGVESDEFWSWHWTLRSARMKSPRPLLGAQRVTDLVMNAVLPWFWSRATVGGDESMRALAEARYLSWPMGEDNSVLRHARLRMFGRKRASAIRTAARQQGLLQIVRDFCDQSNALCEHCEFPALAAGA